MIFPLVDYIIKIFKRCMQSSSIQINNFVMDTITIQLTSPRTMKLLRELEKLHLLRVLKNKISTKKMLSEKYAGKLPIDIAEDLNIFIEQSRDEWDNNI